jgi:hypothetical protein
MSPFNPSGDLTKLAVGVAQQKSKVDTTDAERAIKKGLGRKTPAYPITGQEIRIKERRDEGKEIVLKDGSVWKAKENRGKSQEHAKYWTDKDLVKVKMWDEKYDDYIIVDLSKRDESVWSFEGFEKEASQ